MFPSWKAVRRYREVVIFVVGLMKDPRPLLQHIYEMQVEVYLYEMRTGIPPSIDTDLLKSFHVESTVRLVDDPLHNKYINFYHHGRDDIWSGSRDVTHVCYPSRLYELNCMKEGVELKKHLTEGEEIPPCTMFIRLPNKAVRDSLLSICSEIWEHQAVTDLNMDQVTCSSLEAPRLLNPVIVSIRRCKLPDDFMENLLHQLKGSGDSLQELQLWEMNLAPFESLLDELLEDLVAHHQRKREAGLAQKKRQVGLAQWKLKLLLIGGKFSHQTPNLSDEFVEKWRNRCREVGSINCRIGYYI